MHYRKQSNKRRTARNFNARSSRTKQINISPPPMRGGFRL